MHSKYTLNYFNNFLYHKYTINHGPTLTSGKYTIAHICIKSVKQTASTNNGTINHAGPEIP